jgi:hypothetical protein
MESKAIGWCFMAAAIIFFTGCEKRWQEIELSNDVTLESVLQLSYLEPFDRELLLRSAEKAYGEPRYSGSEGDNNEHVFFEEYVGVHGRVRIYSSEAASVEGWESSRWLEVRVSKLYLEDILKEEVYKKAKTMDGNWKLSVGPENGEWCLTMELEGRAVVKLAEMNREWL